MAGKSLVKTITSGSTVLIACAFLVALAMDYWSAASLIERTHKSRLDQELTLLSQTLENLLWALDDQSVKLVGDAYMAGTDSVSLTVIANHAESPVYSKEKFTSAKTIYGQKEIVHNNEVIGRIRIGLSGESQAGSLSRLMIYSLVLAGFIIVSLSFVVRMLIMRHLAKPLIVLGDWSDRVASGGYDAERPRIELDELGSLADKFDNMAKKIQGRELELVRYRDHLQALVDAQTQELKDAHSELLQKERLATLGQLTATVSHELRNPLGTIHAALFSISTSLAENESYRISRSLELAGRNIDRCVNIIEDLNDYARVKKLVVSENAVDDWLKAVVSEIELPAEIECALELSSGIVAVFDSERLRQVVINLVSNAQDALMDERSEGKRLKIFTRRAGDSLEIGVNDNGCGMSEDVKARLFEPLFSTKGFGVGLGMVIVKNIVEQHRGEVIIESRLGVGSEVIVRLPITQPTG